MYDFVLNNTKCKRNKKPLKVHDVRITNWAVDSRLHLKVGIEVELTGSPDATYSDTFTRLSPADVLYPFSLWGCGGLRTSDKKFVYVYDLSTELHKLPKLLATLRQAAELLVAEETHEKKVAAKVDDLKASDIALAELDQDVEAARRTFEAAQDAYHDSIRTREQRAKALVEEARRAMPFEHVQALESLKAATGLPMVGQTDHLRRPHLALLLQRGDTVARQNPNWQPGRPQPLLGSVRGLPLGVQHADGVFKRYHLELHGLGYALREAVDSGLAFTYPAGHRVQYSVSSTPVRELLALPVRVSREVTVCEDDVKTDKFARVIDTFKVEGVSLGQVLHGILWELSFHGSPAQTEKFRQELAKRVESLKALDKPTV